MNPLRPLAAIALLTVAAFFLLSVASYVPDQIGGAGEVPGNWCGPGGAWTARILVEAWGLGAFYPAILATGYGVALLRRRGLRVPGVRLTGAVLLLPALVGLLHLLPAWEALLRRWDQVQLDGLGGRLGWYLCAAPGSEQSMVEGVPVDHPGGILSRHLGGGGSVLVLLALISACLALMQMGLLRLGRRIWARLHKKPRRPTANFTGAPARPTTPPTPLPETLQNPADEAYGRTASSIEVATRSIHKRDITTTVGAKDLVERIRARRRELERHGSSATWSVTDTEEQQIEDPTPPAQPIWRAEDCPTPRPAATAQAPPTRTVGPASAPTRRRSADGDYTLPPTDLLHEVPIRQDEAHDAEAADTARAIEEVFNQFRIAVKVVAWVRGPVITQYELELLEAGTRVGKVAGYETDLMLKLGTEGIRIVAPLPNRKTIGVEVPNQIKEPVVMRDLVEATDADSMALPVIIGKDVLGEVLAGDLARMPHLLIAGATGMGKSVCLNAIICSLLLYRSPEEVKMIMVDPKQVELNGYDHIPHLLASPITDMTQAHAALEWACKVMDERFYALKMADVRNIGAYNELGADEVERRLNRKGKTLEDLPGIEGQMPYIVIIVDEYADLMMVNKEVEKSIIRLTAKSRACGIHVILATQRPSADVVTGLIKSNLPCRICFRVADRNNSRVVLDASGAENLLGRGDMLYLPPGTSSLVRGQGVWVKDPEIDAIIEHARSQGEPVYDDAIFSMGAIAGAGAAGQLGSEWLSDRQFHEAVWWMYRKDRTGADFLRRQLNVGYNKASKYIDQMEDLGFLSEGKGSKPREFLRSWDDWIDELKANDVVWDDDDEYYRNPFD